MKPRKRIDTLLPQLEQGMARLRSNDVKPRKRIDTDSLTDAQTDSLSSNDVKPRKRIDTLVRFDDAAFLIGFKRCEAAQAD